MEVRFGLRLLKAGVLERLRLLGRFAFGTAVPVGVIQFKGNYQFIYTKIREIQESIKVRAAAFRFGSQKL